MECMYCKRYGQCLRHHEACSSIECYSCRGLVEELEFRRRVKQKLSNGNKDLVDQIECRKCFDEVEATDITTQGLAKD